MKSLRWPAGWLLLAVVRWASGETSGEAQAWPGLTEHAEPRPLAAGAVTTDWPRLLGAQDAPISAETKLRHDFPAAGPPLVSERTTTSW